MKTDARILKIFADQTQEKQKILKTYLIKDKNLCTL